MYDYSLKALGTMVDARNRHRVDAYRQAITTAIGPGTTVLEIGTGIGLFAMLACRLGARHVYAVEANPVVQLGTEIARVNGYADRITFFNAMSADVELPEPVDVVVSDIRGSLPWLADHIPTIVDARTRHLRPGGTQIPQRDTVWAAPVDVAETYDRRLQPWDADLLGFDLGPARGRIVNTQWKQRVEKDAVVAPPRCWATLDYATITAEGARGELTWTISEPATVNGIAVWFDTELVAGVELSNAPDRPHNPVYSQSIFPLEHPVDLAAGATLTVELRTERIDNHYVWTWATTAHAADGTQQARYRQSTFYGQRWTLPTAHTEDPDGDETEEH